MAELIKKRILLQYQTQIDLWWIFALSKCSIPLSLSIYIIYLSLSLSLYHLLEENPRRKWSSDTQGIGYKLQWKLLKKAHAALYLQRKKQRCPALHSSIIFNFRKNKRKEWHDFKHFYLQQYYMVSYRNQWKISKNFFWWMHYT